MSGATGIKFESRPQAKMTLCHHATFDIYHFCTFVQKCSLLLSCRWISFILFQKSRTKHRSSFWNNDIL